MSYKCCNILFLQANKLIFHLQYVHGMSTYKCPITNCYRSFHRKDVFKKHLTANHSFPRGRKLNPLKSFNNSTSSDSVSLQHIDAINECDTDEDGIHTPFHESDCINKFL